MKASLEPGVVTEVEYIVDDARAISFMGDDLRVYATPCIVHDLAYACRDLILAHLDDGQDTRPATVERAPAVSSMVEFFD